MIKRFIIAVILLALVVGGLVGFNLFRDKMISDIFANMPAQTSTVSTVEARASKWNPRIEAIGTVYAAQGVDLTVESAGIVRSIDFSSNQKVEEGQLLVQLDNTAQQADVAAAQTQFELERSNLDRAKALRERGVTANTSLENSEAAARAAEAQLARATSVLGTRQLIAPFSGTIGIAQIDLGEYVSPGTPIATLQDLDTMRVDFTLPEQRLPELSIGQSLAVTAEGVDRVFSGKVVGIDPRIDAASRMVSLRGDVGDASSQITPGQFVRIALELPSEDNVIVLPQTAVITSLYGDHVYIARPSEDDPEKLVARQVFVEVGRRVEDKVEIRSGVSLGEQVITAGQNRLSNGGPVAIDNSVQPGGPAKPAPSAETQPGPEASNKGDPEPSHDSADTEPSQAASP